MKIRLVEPAIYHKEAVLEFKEECIKNDGKINGGGGLENADSYEEWLSHLFDMKREETTPKGLVPADTYLGFDKYDKLVGMINIRHFLNDALLKFYGHVGYNVKKSERRKGYASEMLRQVLSKARLLGIDRLLITCAKENIASSKTIEKNGGVLENEVQNGDDFIKRYWIDL